LHPVTLEKGGLRPALRALARRSGVRAEVRVDIDERLPERVEVAGYYVVSEALTNVAKHAGAAAVRIEASVVDGALRLTVSDNGTGGADPAHGSGLIGLSDRVEALGGRIQVSSPPGGGTSLEATIPVPAALTPDTATEPGHRPTKSR
jgi:signal transduction histidine kinase